MRTQGVPITKSLHFGDINPKLRLIMAFLPRFLQVHSGSFFLFGPRGTGKTTWLRRQLPDALFVNLLRPDVYREMAARPERLRELVRGDLRIRRLLPEAAPPRPKSPGRSLA